MNWNKGGPSGKRGFGFGGFSLASGNKEEPRLPQKAHSAFGASGPSGGYGKNQQLSSFYKIGTKRANFDEENAYFEDDEEESSSTDLPYIPAENSPTRKQFQSGGGGGGSDTRGLDIPSIRTVVNYDVARDIDTHTHRIGRTGRAGEKGVAYTLLTTKDTSFAGDLVRNLEGANQSVSKDLIDLAMQNPWFRKSRFKGGKGKKLNIGGGGLGYRERPGLGSESTERSSSGGAALGNYEAYKPSTGAMGDRMSALKQAFQPQYKNHFVAASGVPPKLTTKSSSSSGWTSAGSLSSLPSEAPEGPDRTHLSYPPSSGTKMSERSRSDRNAEDRGSHRDRESHYRHGDRHSGGDRDRYGERDRHSDRERHSDNRNGEGSHRDKEGRSERDGGERSGTHKDSFAVPDPPKRKKSRWDN
uniref:ATP-dependent RNA helicase DDX42-like n=1 Tax=Sinocyclocheilus rhinocerous TaxID=307959 RepID=A0A673IMU9_9TELE